MIPGFLGKLVDLGKDVVEALGDQTQKTGHAVADGASTAATKTEDAAKNAAGLTKEQLEQIGNTVGGLGPKII